MHSFIGLWLQSCGIGLSIAAPVGPIGLLCIRRTLAYGRLSGCLTGLGAATADAFYGALAVLGVTALVRMFTDHALLFRLAGGLFLIAIALRILRARPVAENGAIAAIGLSGAFFSTFLLTLTNPMTILAFAALFSGVGVNFSANGALPAIGFVSGVFTGSMLWWLILSSAVGRYRRKIDAPKMLWINRISGLIILGYGIHTITRAGTAALSSITPQDIKGLFSCAVYIVSQS